MSIDRSATENFRTNLKAGMDAGFAVPFCSRTTEKWLDGKYDPNLRNVEKCAHALGVSVADLISSRPLKFGVHR